MLCSEHRGDGGDHRRAGDDPGVAAISGWEPRLSSYRVVGKLLYNSSPAFTSIIGTLILMFRITRAGVGVGDGGARDDGQEQTCPLCSPLHSNNHHHLDQCPLLLSIFILKVVLANPLSPLVHDDSDSLYDTEGSNVGRSILGTEATTTIAQVDFQKEKHTDWYSTPDHQVINVVPPSLCFQRVHTDHRWVKLDC